MPGALPSGSDSSQFALKDFGIVGAGFSALVGFTQGAITSHYQNEVGNSTPWGAASAFLFDGLEAALGFPIAIIKAVVEQITGVVMVGVNTIHDVLSGLAHWADVLLPDMIMGPITALVNAIVAILGPIPIIGTVVENLAGWLSSTNQTATSAQESANNANAAIAELVASIDAGESGALITDSFNGAQDSSANGLGANWEQLYESGSGTLGLTGDGYAHWYASGSSGRVCYCRYSTATLNTDYQKTQLVLERALGNWTNDEQIWLMLRINATTDTFVMAKCRPGVCEIGYCVGGTDTYTRLGTTASFTSKAGDLLEFQAGIGTTGDDPYVLQLLQNGNAVCIRTDSSHASQLGASYRYAGFAAVAGMQLIFTGAQKPPPNIAVFTANDRTLA